MNTVPTRDERQPGRCSYGRVTSEPIGRDLNPNDRGDGYGYMAGALDVGIITPRLVRQYFPKECYFSTIIQSELDHAMERLNNRPRKSLGMLTPHQVKCGIKQCVAL